MLRTNVIACRLSVLVRHGGQGRAQTPLGNDWWRNNRHDGHWDGNAGLDGLAVDLGLRALARDVARLAAAVARLSGSVQGSSVRRSTVAGDVAELATGVTLHGLSLAVTSKVVGPTTLVAGGWTSTTSESTTGEAAEAPTRRTSGTATETRTWAGIGTSTLDTWSERIQFAACLLDSTYCKVTDHAARVAAAVCCATAQAESGTVSLHVSETLAMVALLC